MESLEGKRGIPAFVRHFRLWLPLGRSDVINNAETLASVPHIMLMAANSMPRSA